MKTTKKPVAKSAKRKPVAPAGRRVSATELVEIRRYARLIRARAKKLFDLVPASPTEGRDLVIQSQAGAIVAYAMIIADKLAGQKSK